MTISSNFNATMYSNSVNLIEPLVMYKIAMILAVMSITALTNARSPQIASDINQSLNAWHA